jgi:hypothetical protein
MVPHHRFNEMKPKSGWQIGTIVKARKQHRGAGVQQA